MTAETNTAEPVAPYRSTAAAGRDGLPALVRSEWTKFRTVRGWTAGMALAALITVLIGLLGPLGTSSQCESSGGGGGGHACGASQPALGPDGQPVSDTFSFVHRPVTGDGGITVRLTSMRGYYQGANAAPAESLADMRQRLEPWARAGIVVKASTRPGAPYVAVVVTGANGVRMESDFSSSEPALGGRRTGSTVSPSSPQWLRLSRTGDSFTGYLSADGAHWTAVGSQTVRGIPSRAQAGMLVSSPDHGSISHQFGGTSVDSSPSVAVAAFDHVGFAGAWTGGSFAAPPATGQDAGPAGSALVRNTYTRSGGEYRVEGSGDIAPGTAATVGDAKSLESALIGVFAGLIAVVAVAVLTITSEYRRGLIRSTFSATPRRGAVLAAKSTVVGAVGFAVGLVSAGIAVPLVRAMNTAKGSYVLPASAGAEARVVVGTAVLLALVAVFAVAAGTLLRRGAGAVAAVIALVVLPYVLATASVLPAGASEWLLRLTPAAGFAVQQTLAVYPGYAEAASGYTPAAGYYPLAPWAGLAVTAAYAALAAGLAWYALRRRDV
jgi:ABC-type transport system involved in multi-copper enzyme maturation permease subunit